MQMEANIESLRDLDHPAIRKQRPSRADRESLRPHKPLRSGARILPRYSASRDLIALNLAPTPVATGEDDELSLGFFLIGGAAMESLAILGGRAVRTCPFTPWPLFSDKEEARILDVLRSRAWGGQPFPGKYSTQFAAGFAKLHDTTYGQCVNTGTVAIQAALKAIDIRPGDEVLVPAYTWEGTVGPVLLVNAVPVFVDVDPDTYCMDAASRRSSHHA